MVKVLDEGMELARRKAKPVRVKLLQAACVAASAAVSVGLIAWAVKTLA